MDPRNVKVCPSLMYLLKHMFKRSMHTDLDSLSPVVLVAVINNLENSKFTEIMCQTDSFHDPEMT